MRSRNYHAWQSQNKTITASSALISHILASRDIDYKEKPALDERAPGFLRKIRSFLSTREEGGATLNKVDLSERLKEEKELPESISCSSLERFRRFSNREDVWVAFKNLFKDTIFSWIKLLEEDDFPLKKASGRRGS
eukprot:Sdes_comp19906_c0_seq1m12304